MNFQVNVILDSELRSGSSISQKFVIRLVAVVVPSIFLILLILLAFKTRSTRKNRLRAEYNKNGIKSSYNIVLKMQNELRDHRNMIQDIEGWRVSRSVWHQTLRYLPEIVPANVQLTRLMVSEKFESVDGVPSRIVRMYIKGKVIGENSEKDVKQFKRALEGSPLFRPIIDSVEVRRFVAPVNLAPENFEESSVRVFDIECKFVPKKMFKRSQNAKPAAGEQATRHAW